MDIPALITGACGAVLAHTMLRLWRNRKVPGAVACLLLFGAIAIYVPSMLLPAPSSLLTLLGYVAAATIPPLTLIAAVEYTGLELPRWHALRYLLVGGVVALALANVWTDHSHAFAAIADATDAGSRAAAVRAARRGPFLATTVISYAVALAVIAVAAYTLIRSPARRRDMTILLMVAGSVAAVDAAHYALDFTIAGVMPTPFAVVVGTLAATALLYRSNLFDLRPVARSVLVESVKDGMLVVDDQRRILDANGAATELLGRPRPVLVGQAAADLLPREFAAMLQSTVHLRAELAVRLNGQRTWFEVDVTPLEMRGRRAGHLIVARDISERQLVQEALQESRRALEAANARLVEQSVTDPLTGLKNRRFLFQRLNEEMNRHHRTNGVLGLLVVDIDHFKAVNDTHGHPIGDEALIQVAATLQSTVRDCDVVARLGGEEFAVIAVNTEAAGLLSLAERIRRAVSRTPVARDTNRPMILTASIGVAFAGPDTRSADGLFAEADRYLYEAKHRGRNRVVAPAPPLQAQSTG